MDSNQVRILLEKYWQGETSVVEESRLKAYFRSDDVAEELEQYRALFQFFDAEALIKFHPVLKIPTRKSNTFRILSSAWVRGAAAAVILALGIYFFMIPGQENIGMRDVTYIDTYESPELAYEEAKKALFYLSGKMNKGVSTAANSLDKMRTLYEILNAN